MSSLKKVCVVCGDKALGYNFNAITCESCKAFFRRNALSEKKLVCPFNENCEITVITRRFCQRCRLKKCLKLGMKKELIMSEEDKEIKKKKIEQNREKRNICSVSKRKRFLERKGKRIKNEYDGNSGSYTLNELSSPQLIITESDNSNSFCSTQSDEVADPAEIVNSIISVPENSTWVINKIMRSPKGAVDIMSRIFDSPPDALKLINHLIQYPGNALKIISKIMNSPFDALTVFTKFMSSPKDAQEIISKIVDSPADVVSFIKQLMSSPEDALDIMNKFINTPAEALKKINLMVCRDGVDKVTSPPTSLKRSESSNCSVLNSVLNSAQSSESISTSGSQELPDYLFMTTSNREIKSATVAGESMLLNSVLSSRTDETRNILEDVEDRPIQPNSIESVLCEAIKLEYETFNSIPSFHGDSRDLNEAEQAKLTELTAASKALYLPIDDDISSLISEDERMKCEGNQQNPQLLKLINLTAVAIRRLIKMSKKINAFKDMCQEDQVALLKGGCTEMMIMRSAMSYDRDRATWKIPHSKEDMSNIKTEVLKLAKGNVYEEHERFIQTFEPKWRMDENIILIMCAILLFKPTRPRVIHSDVIKLEQNSYYYLLRRYLESIFPGCEAKSTFIKLIQKISEVERLNDVIIGVYLDVNPSQVEPLLREIFDLKNR